MTVTSIEEALADSRKLVELARGSRIDVERARAFLALLADVPIRQAIRMATTAKRDVERQRNRMSRKGGVV